MCLQRTAGLPYGIIIRMYKEIPIVIVAGIGARTRAIGKDNQILFHVPDDLKRFKELSMGHPIIMGRKTFESIVALLGKPLPGRFNVVITRDESYEYPGAAVAHSLEGALAIAAAQGPEEIHIGGGAEIYTQALPYTDKLFLTLFDDDRPGDTFFPPYADTFTEVARLGVRTHEDLAYEWVDYERK